MLHSRHQHMQDQLLKHCSIHEGCRGNQQRWCSPPRARAYGRAGVLKGWHAGRGRPRSALAPEQTPICLGPPEATLYLDALFFTGCSSDSDRAVIHGLHLRLRLYRCSWIVLETQTHIVTRGMETVPNMGMVGGEGGGSSPTCAAADTAVMSIYA